MPGRLEDLVDLSAPFALIEKEGRVTLYQGPVLHLQEMDDLHRSAWDRDCDIVFALPYRCVAERGFEARGDEPIIALEARQTHGFDADVFAEMLPDWKIALDGDVRPSIDDAAYAALITSVMDNEIEGGNISQTTISRVFSGRVKDFSVALLLGVYKKLLTRKGQYMTVLMANPAGGNYIIGATPERHLEITGNETVMCPIAGTLRKEDRETFEARLDRFLEDPKEINELFQVVDEELKMMGRISPMGGRILGPFLRETGAVVHSEYELVGLRGEDTIDAFRKTLHAPTVLGSPMESAARVIAKYEPASRRYYAGEFGIYKKPRRDVPNGDLDAAILLRCAEFFSDGRFAVQAGGGIVRDSVPENEARESRAKALAMVGLLTGEGPGDAVYLTPEIRARVAQTLASRNAVLAPFWMEQQPNFSMVPRFDGLRVAIVNNEDDFAAMIGHVIGRMGCTVSQFDTFAFDPQVQGQEADIVILGPGPGDPNDTAHPRMAKLHAIIAALLEAQTPLLGVCLGHQTLSRALGLPVRKQAKSTQGVQRALHVFGQVHRLGFYNSFSPELPEGRAPRPDIKFDLDENGRVVAMMGDRIVGFQFHPESILSQSGYQLLEKALSWLAMQR